MSQIKSLFDLINLIHKFDKITRKAPVAERDTYESDSEHSFQLAIVCWYLIDKFKLKFDISLTLKYCLAHDLVEVYAGDTDVWNASINDKNNKQSRELSSLQKIKDEIGDFSSLISTIEKYEEKSDPESQLVYLIDKIQPVINTYLAGNKYYVDSGVTFETYNEWLSEKQQKYKNIPIEIINTIGELKDFLKNNSSGFFAPVANREL